MEIRQHQIAEYNEKHKGLLTVELDYLATRLGSMNVDVGSIVQKLMDFQVAIPSWALGAGGTRFGRFSYGGEPASLEQKIQDVGMIHQLTQTAGAISLHIPWDRPTDIQAIKEAAVQNNIVFDAVNSNAFQDQPNAKESYKFGSLSSTHEGVREQAIAHNKEVVEIGEKLGSKSMTIWLPDGANFPGQHNFQRAFTHTLDSVRDIYGAMPHDWRLFLEYKPYEPNFYSTVISDWGTSLLLAKECGDRAFTLVDLGHHLPNTNIEQIVAILMLQGRLGGFHFNDSKYGDDDLTVGAIKPYALFLIFSELVYGMENNTNNPPLAWMIDASHNTKDPLEDLIQSLEAIMIAYARALLVDHAQLKQAQLAHDVVQCQELLQDAFRTDVRPLVKQARLLAGGAINPLDTYREFEIRKGLIKERGHGTRATGL
ncbi:MAG: TIM barrel protein [Flavobacteriaceae bacterium]